MDFYLVVSEKMTNFAPEILFSRGIMTMRKIFSTLFVLPLMVACSSDSGDESTNTIDNSNLPETEIYVQGQLLGANTAETRSYLGEYQWPYVNTVEGWETARFSIRADGYIPGYIDQSSVLYYGRSAGKDGRNRGEVYTLYPYGRYNDRDLDYYQKDKKTGNNIGMFRYVLDQAGLKTQFAIKKAPKVVDILQDEIDDNKKNLDKVYEWMALEAANPGYLDKHVLWYVVKEVGMRNGWHVNGVIVDYEVKNKSEITYDDQLNEVEIDIHQQTHQDWNEIKTSVHIRADVESVTINIPLNQADVIEKDDFAIRVFDFNYKEYNLTHTVTHDQNGITIEISNIPAELIQELKQNFHDGLTIEIHSYCTTEDIWEQLSKSSVVKLGKSCTVKGQVTSALRPDEKVTLYAPNTKK